MKRAVPAMMALALSCGRTDLANWDPRVTIESIAVGNRSSCVLFSDGNVRCWGAFGKANVLYSDRREAIQPFISAETIRYPTYVKSISVHHNGCGVTIDGDLSCWGWGPYPPSCAAHTLCENARPASFGSIEQFVASSFEGGCVVANGGRVSCWGDWDLLGNDPGYDIVTPVPKEIAFELPVREISAGKQSACVILIDDTVRCWGVSTAGNAAPNVYLPPKNSDVTSVYVRTPTVFPDAPRAAHIAVGDDQNCILTEQGELYCWGYNYGYHLSGGAAPPNDVIGWGGVGTVPGPVLLTPMRQAVPGRVQSFSLTYDTLCALNDSGDVYCWGLNTYGQTGSGDPPFCRDDCTSPYVGTPTRVDGLGEVVDVKVDITHACALTKDQRVKCWGKNLSGELGDGTRVNSVRPVDIARSFLEAP